MQIIKNTVVSLHYKMYDADNQLIDQTQPEEPMTYLHGGYDGISRWLKNNCKASKLVIKLMSPCKLKRLLTTHEPELVRQEPIDVFPRRHRIRNRAVFEADDPETGDVIVFRVTDITDGQVTVDGNHPFMQPNPAF